MVNPCFFVLRGPFCPRDAFARCSSSGGVSFRLLEARSDAIVIFLLLLG